MHGAERERCRTRSQKLADSEQHLVPPRIGPIRLHICRNIRYAAEQRRERGNARPHDAHERPSGVAQFIAGVVQSTYPVPTLAEPGEASGDVLSSNLSPADQRPPEIAQRIRDPPP